MWDSLGDFLLLRNFQISMCAETLKKNRQSLLELPFWTESICFISYGFIDTFQEKFKKTASMNLHTTKLRLLLLVVGSMQKSSFFTYSS